MRTAWLVACAITASSARVAAEPVRAARPHAVSGGVSLIGGGDGGGDVLPFLTAQGVIDLDPRFSVVADLSYFTSGDRIFGPRALLRAGLRAYLRDGTASPFAGIGGLAYHEFDVDYPYSDASQSAGSSYGASATLGHELTTAHGLSWVVEGSALLMHAMTPFVPGGLVWQFDTLVGYRF